MESRGRGKTQHRVLFFFCFLLTEIDHHPNIHAGVLFGRLISMLQAEIFGGGPSTMLSLPFLASGALPHFQNALTATPTWGSPTLYFSLPNKDWRLDTDFIRIHKQVGLVWPKNYKTSSSHPALAFRHSFKHDTWSKPTNWLPVAFKGSGHTLSKHF